MAQVESIERFCVVIIGVTVAVFEGMLMLIIHWTLLSLLRWFQLKNPYARCQDGYSAAPLGAPWKLLSAIKSSKFKKMPNTIFLPNESTLLGQSLDLKSLTGFFWGNTLLHHIRRTNSGETSFRSLSWGLLDQHWHVVQCPCLVRDPQKQDRRSHGMMKSKSAGSL